MLPVQIGDNLYNHVWLFSCKKTRNIKINDDIHIFARLSVYDKKQKWCLKFPYKVNQR